MEVEPRRAGSGRCRWDFGIGGAHDLRGGRRPLSPRGFALSSARTFLSALARVLPNHQRPLLPNWPLWLRGAQVGTNRALQLVNHCHEVAACALEFRPEACLWLPVQGTSCSLNCLKHVGRDGLNVFGGI